MKFERNYRICGLIKCLDRLHIGGIAEELKTGVRFAGDHGQCPEPAPTSLAPHEGEDAVALRFATQRIGS